MLEIKNTATQKKNAFHRQTGNSQGINELEDRSTETSQNGMQRKKKEKDTEHCRTLEKFQNETEHLKTLATEAQR